MTEDDVDFSISKGLAATHEAYRRAVRGELAYAQTLIDELRHRVMRADDWLFGRMPRTAVFAKFERRSSHGALAALANSCAPYGKVAILRALQSLAWFYRNQVVLLHGRFQPSRPLAIDLEAVDTVLGQSRRRRHDVCPPRRGDDDAGPINRSNAER